MKIDVKYVKGLAIACSLWLVFCAAEGCTWEHALSFAQPAGAFPIPSDVGGHSGAAEIASSKLVRVPFGVGEYLEFSVNYNILRAGTATMSVVGV
ncbi:unnamed protein product, partial [marine sediment metagenome]